MLRTINFAIDLGTTNSLIAKFDKGTLEVFRNPAGMKQTLPSVVGFRKDRVLIGDKAKEYAEKEPQNVIGGFKRKMGSDETFFIANSGSFKTPVELSAMVLKELKNFIYTGEQPESIVITIPASFDTIQSNATKKAGYEAGFSEVVLLQEPIAASLAFANKANEPVSGKWLVYDLGGGTFDVALVSITEEEMKVVDHEGDNFLGGLDFDNLIITRLIIPYLAEKFSFPELESQMMAASGKYNKLYYQLLYKTEEAKILLSTSDTAEIEFEFPHPVSNETEEVYFTINRTDFEVVIIERIHYTIDFIQKLLQRNNMNSAAINEIILVGGSTYIPIVRNALKERLQVNVNCSIDPTTAVVVGAAYYAGSKTKQVKPALAPKSPETKGNRNTPPTPSVNVKTAYQKNSREQEEYFTALVLQAPPDSLYRITREDGGYDSGIKNVTERISEMLNLLPDTTNFFKLKFFDATQNILPSNEEDIVIVQGKFSIDGQPLPHDICIEVDDDDTKTTFLEVVFERNTLLPIKKSITKTLSRSILKGSSDQLLINVLEGSRFGSPQANLPIGLISIKGTELTRDLIKGCDIDLTFEISESRDITIKAYISLTDQEYAQVFNPSVRAVNTSRLKEEIDYLIRQGQRNQEELTRNERYEESAVLQQSISELNQLLKKIEQLNADDVTDARYQADELKRKYASIIENAGKGPLVIKLKEDYFGSKSLCEYYMQQSANPQLKKRFEEIVNSEPEWLHTDNAAYIKRKTRELWTLTWDIRKKDLAYLTQTYLYYALKPDNEYTDQKQIKLLKKRGDEALERKNPEELLSLLVQMHDFLINKNDDEMLKGTGLSG